MNEHENALLSIIAQDPEWTRKHASHISPVLFDYEPCRLIYEAITECGGEWDMASVTSVLRRRNKLDMVGGPAGVSEFWMNYPVVSMAGYHLEAVRNAAALRRALRAHQEAQTKLEAALTQGTEDAAGLLSGIREELDAAGMLPGRRLDRLTAAQAMEVVISQMEERAKNPGKIAGHSTGFARLDKYTHGLQQGHVWVFAGGPGDGKSTMMQNVLEAAAGVCKTGVYQLEMPIEEQAMRFLASDAQVDSGSILSGCMTREEQSAIEEGVNRLKKAGTEFVNTDDATAEDIMADIAASDYRVVMVDYLQLLDVTQGKNETRELAISRIAKDLKRLAKRKHITILTGSQLNDDGRLRESRSIGQHADKVVLVKQVEIDGEPDMSRRELILEKNRGGPPKVKIPLRFAGEIFRFRESTIQNSNEPADWIDTMQSPKKKSRR